jgi:hypothetical protein
MFNFYVMRPPLPIEIPGEIRRCDWRGLAIGTVRGYTLHVFNDFVAVGIEG